MKEGDTKMLPGEVKQLDFARPRSGVKNEEIHYAIIDVVEQLTDSTRAKKYWNDMKEREPQLSSVCGQLMKLPSKDGKLRQTEVANLEGIFRIIQSIPSPKAEPFKRWFSQVAAERVEEIRDPELAIKRGRERAAGFYLRRGHSEEWTATRLRSIEKRNQLTDVLKKMGATSGKEYAHITAQVHHGAFNLLPSEHAEMKGLPRKNPKLRDHMVRDELSITEMVETLFVTQAEQSNPQTEEERMGVAARVAAFGQDIREAYKKRFGKEPATPEHPARKSLR